VAIAFRCAFVNFLARLRPPALPMFAAVRSSRCLTMVAYGNMACLPMSNCIYRNIMLTYENNGEINLLTPQQKRVRDFILEYQRDHGRRPTYEQIGAALGMRSLDTVGRHVTGLQKKGALVLLYIYTKK
jgi:LexA DNA binding domain-containing protein